MSLLPLMLVCGHLIIGLFCAYLAYEYKQKAEHWFLAGALLGGLALLAFCFLRNWKRPVRNRRSYVVRNA